MSIEVQSDVAELQLKLRVHHLQIDSMLSDSRFEVMLAPKDSGHYSMLRSGAYRSVDVVY